MDPALRELLQVTDGGDEEVQAIIRLKTDSADIPGIRIVARAGNVATCRIRRKELHRVHDHHEVVSLKAPKLLSASRSSAEPVKLEIVPTDTRRPAGIGGRGRGTTIAFLDFGCDFLNPSFRNSDGSTRILALWDQRTGNVKANGNSYGYGRIFLKCDIDAALSSQDPYNALGYWPGASSHGTHVMDIAAGNGRGGTPCGMAPECNIIFVHISTADTTGLANLGDSVALLEALDFVVKTAGAVPLAINISAGRHAGPHDGSTPAERFIENLLGESVNRMIVQSAGNYFDKMVHASGRLSAGATRAIRLHVNHGDHTPNEFELWTEGDNYFDVAVENPAGERTRVAKPGHVEEIHDGDILAGRIYNRTHDPNNGNNHINIFLYPNAPAGTWTIHIYAIAVTDGVYHAWIERDTSCGTCQSHFEPVDADPFCTTTSLANGQTPLIVGAYDHHSNEKKIGAFSSAGPTRDGRIKPDLVAPGRNVLAARSPYDSRGSPPMRRSGSSMAAPHVTGAVALCMEAASGKLTSAEIRELIIRSTEGASHESVLRYGNGYLNVRRAVEMARNYRTSDHEMLTQNKTSMTKKISYPVKRHTHPLTLPKPMPKTWSLPPRQASLSSMPDAVFAGLVTLGRTFSFANQIHVLAWPGQTLSDEIRAGDVIIKTSPGEPGVGLISTVGDPGIFTADEVRQSTGGSVKEGFYVVIQEGTLLRQTGASLRRLLDAFGNLLPGHIVLRISDGVPAIGSGQSFDMESDPPDLIDITHAGKFRLAYDRLSAYGVIEDAPARDKRKFQGTEAVKNALDRFGSYLEHVESDPLFVLTGGMFNADRTDSNHSLGIAIDIDGLWWSDTEKFMAADAPGDWGRYLRIEAALRKGFGMVLNYDYNTNHHDHWHCEATGSTKWSKRKSQILFVQRALNVYWGQALGVDGKMGTKTKDAISRVGFDFSKPDEWDRFLDVIILRGPYNASSDTEMADTLDYRSYQNPQASYSNTSPLYGYSGTPPVFSSGATSKPVADVNSKLPSYGSDDALHGFKLGEQLDFFKRLAAHIASQDKDSLAALLLNYWTTGSGQDFVIPNDRIKNHPRIQEELETYRNIILSKRKSNWSEGNRIVGVMPRLKEGTWNGIDDLPLHYHGESFEIVTLLQFYTTQNKIDLDLFTSLHNTSLVSDFVLSGKRLEERKVKVYFKKWESYIADNYNWDAGEHLTVPNPDYQNKYGVKNPVRPKQEKVRIYHNHQLELEKNNLARSFNFKSQVWQVQDPKLLLAEDITY